MGSYLYGVSAKHITVDGQAVHLCRYIFKPYLHDPQWPPHVAATMAKYDRTWQGRELPKLVIVGGDDGKFQDGMPVHNFHSIRGFGGSVIRPTAVLYDDPYGFGDIVGFLKREGRSWTIVKEHSSHWVGSQGAEGDKVETGKFCQRQWVDETGYHSKSTLVEPMTWEQAFKPRDLALAGA